ncbi:MAG: 1-acyl-sn-glycerol-3-phosphate acyltransferase [Clostridium sp.]|nr:1-acyl-sn-glycerol-3-phosphate acyltransferase [Clostridium sp.]
MDTNSNNENLCVKPSVLDYDDIVRMVPRLEGKRGLIEGVMKLLSIDKVNDIHARHCAHPGPQFCHEVVEELRLNLRIDNREILDNLPEGPFITVSNHAYGALDGIILIDLIGMRRPGFKVMVNMTLNLISAMRPNFIAVDALASDDPKKRAVSMNGIREAITQVRSGQPLGFFPAGAVSKLNRHLWLEDREWQPNIGRLIKQLKVPVIPIFFHGGNSAWFNFLGLVSWQLRTLRLPAEVFNKNGKTIHISIGEPISVEEQALHSATPAELCAFLKEKTYSMRTWK